MTKLEEPNKETKEMWEKDPNNWKMGIFYFNRNDKRIFIPKRIPALGFAFNYANPIAIILSILLITIIIYNFSKW